MAKFRFHKVPFLYQTLGTAGEDADRLNFIKRCAYDLIEHNTNFEPTFYSITKSKDIETSNGPMLLWSLSCDLTNPDQDVVGCFIINSILLFYKDHELYCNARTNSKQIDVPALWKLDYNESKMCQQISKLDDAVRVLQQIRSDASSYMAVVFKLD